MFQRSKPTKLKPAFGNNHSCLLQPERLGTNESQCEVAAMAFRGSVVALALLAAMLMVGEAEAGRRHRDRPHHSPPAPPGCDEAPGPDFRGEPSEAPSDGFSLAPEAPSDGFPLAPEVPSDGFPLAPEAPSDGFPSAPEAGGPEGSPSRRQSESFTDAPFAEGPGSFAEGPGSFAEGPSSFADGPGSFAEGPDADCPPGAEGAEADNPERKLTDFADSPFADSPFADSPLAYAPLGDDFAAAPLSSGEGSAPESGC